VEFDPVLWTRNLYHEVVSAMPDSRPPYPPQFQRTIVALERTGLSSNEVTAESQRSAQAVRNGVDKTDAPQAS